MRTVQRFYERLTRLQVVVLVACVTIIASVIGTTFVVHAETMPTTFYGCLGPGGLLKRVNTNGPQACDSQDIAVTWSQTGPQGLQGPQGPQGPKGDTGVQGPAGADGVSGYQIVTSNADTFILSRYLKVTVDCPSGKHAIGGGYSVSHPPFLAPADNDQKIVDAPIGSDGVSGDGWTVEWWLNSNPYLPSGGGPVTVYAICATVGA